MAGLLDDLLLSLPPGGLLGIADLPGGRVDPLPVRPDLRRRRRGRGSALATDAITESGQRRAPGPAGLTDLPLVMGGGSRPPLLTPLPAAGNQPGPAPLPNAMPGDGGAIQPLGAEGPNASGIVQALAGTGLFGGSGDGGGFLSGIDLPLALAGLGALSTTQQSLTPQNPLASALQGAMSGMALQDQRAGRDLERQALEAELARQERQDTAMEQAIAGLPPEQQALARAAPEGFLNAQVEAMFSPPDLPTGMLIDPETGLPDWIPGYREGRAFIEAAGRSSQTVILPPEEGRALARAGELSAEYIAALRDDAAEAQKLMGLIDQVENALARVGETGTFTEARATTTNVLRSLGLGRFITDEQLAQAQSVQELQGLLAQVVGQNIQALGAGAGLSDADREYAGLMFVRFTNDAAANARVLDNSREQTQLRIDSYEDAQREFRENDGVLSTHTPLSVRRAREQRQQRERDAGAQTEVASLTANDIGGMTADQLRALVNRVDDLTPEQAAAAEARWRALGLPE